MQSVINDVFYSVYQYLGFGIIFAVICMVALPTVRKEGALKTIQKIHRKSEIAQLCGEASSKSEQIAKCLKCGEIFLYVNLYQNIAEILTVCYNRIMKFAGVFDK